MKLLLMFFCSIALARAVLAEEEAARRPDTIVVSAIVREQPATIVSETLIIHQADLERSVWKFQGRTSFEGETAMNRREFWAYSDTLVDELKKHKHALPPKASSEIYVFTVLAGGSVVASEAVGPQFFSEARSSSLIVKPLLGQIRQSVRKGYYLYEYLSTTFPESLKTRGYEPEKARRREGRVVKEQLPGVPK